MMEFTLPSDVRIALHAIRDLAFKRPVNMRDVAVAFQTEQGRRKRMEEQSLRMTNQSGDCCVTFSVESGHPSGLCRHMSMSIMLRAEPDWHHLPTPLAVWTVAVELGFWGSIEDCIQWVEPMSEGGRAINIAQPIRS